MAIVAAMKARDVHAGAVQRQPAEGEAVARSAPSGALVQRAASHIDINQSPRMLAQRRALHAIFGPAMVAQRKPVKEGEQDHYLDPEVFGTLKLFLVEGSMGDEVGVVRFRLGTTDKTAVWDLASQRYLWDESEHAPKAVDASVPAGTVLVHGTTAARFTLGDEETVVLVPNAPAWFSFDEEFSLQAAAIKFEGEGSKQFLHTFKARAPLVVKQFEDWEHLDGTLSHQGLKSFGGNGDVEARGVKAMHPGSDGYLVKKDGGRGEPELVLFSAGLGKVRRTQVQEFTAHSEQRTVEGPPTIFHKKDGQRIGEMLASGNPEDRYVKLLNEDEIYQLVIRETGRTREWLQRRWSDDVQEIAREENIRKQRQFIGLLLQEVASWV
jgi:hypothetical protein